MACRSSGVPPRSIAMRSGSVPTCIAPPRITSVKVVVGVPSMDTMRSPGSMPARAAGDPGATAPMTGASAFTPARNATMKKSRPKMMFMTTPPEITTMRLPTVAVR
jgi:hypothetical protein